MSATMTMTMSSQPSPSPPPPLPPPSRKPTFPTAMTAGPPTTTATTTTNNITTTTPCCPSCGSALPPHSSSSTTTTAAAENEPPHAPALLLQAAQRQIEDLQAQVRLLNEKAAAAVDRWADYEDELTRLRAASVTTSTSANTTTTTATTTTTSTSSPRSSFLPTASRLSQLLSPRRSLANLTGGGNAQSGSGGSNSNNKRNSSSSNQPQPQPQQHSANGSSGGGTGFLSSPPRLKPRPQQASSSSTSTPPHPPHPPNNNNNNNNSNSAERNDLLTALSREKELRRRAEGRLSDTSREVEELSATLFEQANEMVAAERRARAALEERVGVLETRDAETSGRLQRLEGALGRIERVRALLEERES